MKLIRRQAYFIARMECLRNALLMIPPQNTKTDTSDRCTPITWDCTCLSKSYAEQSQHIEKKISPNTVAVSRAENLEVQEACHGGCL
jgi:hypothetical protein